MFKHLLIGSIGLSSILFSVACEGGGSNDVDPRIIEGGGLGDGEIDGMVNIYVIDGDDDSNTAIASAQIFVGEAGEEAIEGVTDEAGLLTVKDGSLAGPTTITVVADGFVTSTWYGANGANITIPLDSKVTRNDFGKATVTGTIDGWAELPDPPTNHFLAAIVGYSQTSELGDPANEIVQPTGVGLPPNACLRAIGASDCSWSLITRSGDVALSATIIDIDNKGTETDADDTSEVVGYAYKLGVDVEDGVGQSNLALTMVAAAEHTPVEFDVPALPTGVDSAGVLLGLDLEEDGVIIFGIADIAEASSILAPNLSGELSGASYRAYAFASNEAEEDEDSRPSSAILLRDIEDVSGGINFGDWMVLPSALSHDAGSFSFVTADQTALATAEVLDSNNDKIWAMVFLDGRTSFTLPTIAPDPLGTGSFTFAVSSFDDPIDLLDFRIDVIGDTIERLATNRTSFTR